MYGTALTVNATIVAIVQNFYGNTDVLQQLSQSDIVTWHVIGACTLHKTFNRQCLILVY